MNSQNWKKVPRKNYGTIEEFLRKREKDCVSVCARFKQMKKKDEVWALPESKAIMLHCRQSLYPVLDGQSNINLPSFLNRILLKVYIHSIQGQTQDVEITEKLMEKRAYTPTQRIDYDLMAIDSPPPASSRNYGPDDLVLRPPECGDIDKIFELQSAYEQEEVLPKGAVFYPAACRANLERMLKTEEMLLAVINREIIGKINTSAKSFTRYQIGGVYVRPRFRGRGIATRMTSIFMEYLISKGCGASLFVKKNNSAALAVYKNAGFITHGNYRISYF